MANELRRITVVGGDLYRVAADYLGDASQWTRLALLNGISDPMLLGPVSLLVPQTDASQTGGLPPQ